MARDLGPDLVALLPRLRRFGRALTGSAADADDLAQEACQRALRRGSLLREPHRLDAWLFSIMRNLWIDHGRSHAQRYRADLDAADGMIGTDGEAAAEQRLMLARVRAALALLPAEQRAVIVLVCVDGLSYREAAEVMNIPVGTVMSRLSRGRLALAADLALPRGDNVTALAPRRIQRRPS